MKRLFPIGLVLLWLPVSAIIVFYLPSFLLPWYFYYPTGSWSVGFSYISFFKDFILVAGVLLIVSCSLWHTSLKKIAYGILLAIALTGLSLFFVGTEDADPYRQGTIHIYQSSKTGNLERYTALALGFPVPFYYELTHTGVGGKVVWKENFIRPTDLLLSEAFWLFLSLILSRSVDIYRFIRFRAHI